MNDSPDFAAVTQVQQGIWSKGDFAMVANLVYFASENLAEALGDRPRRARARRRLRQRQRRHRRRAAHLGQRGQRRLRPGAARARPRTRRRRAAGDRVRRGRRPGPALRGRQLRRRHVDLRRDVRPRPAENGRRAAARGQTRRPDRDGQLVAPTAPSARCSRRSPSTRRRRPASTSPLLWGTEEHVRELFGDRISDLRIERRDLAPAASAPPTTTSSSSAPTSARPRRPTNGSAPRAKRR